MTYEQKAPEFLSVREAAELLRVAKRTITNWRRSGRLPFATLDGGRIRIRRAHALALLAPVALPAKSWQHTRHSDSDELPAALMRPVRKAEFADERQDS
jgi:excisionase family DNA binding protein